MVNSSEENVEFEQGIHSNAYYEIQYITGECLVSFNTAIGREYRGDVATKLSKSSGIDRRTE